MNKRYQRNMNALTPEENEKLREYKVCVVGCGGLGGYIIEELGRLGIGQITAVDGDVFEETNLNRQLLSHMGNLGKSKAEEAKARMQEINPEITVIPIQGRLDGDNCHELIDGHHLVMDALDNIPSRKILENCCEELGLPLIHGAIAGWYGQVSTILPGDRIIDRLYPAESEKGAEMELGNPAFTPAVIASIQVAEAVKVLLGREGILRNKLLSVNLLDQEYEIFSI